MTVVFVAPYLMETTLRFVSAVAGVSRCALVTNEPVARIPRSIRARLAGNYQVTDALDPGQIAQAARAVGSSLGPEQRLLGTLEHLQVPLARAREALGLAGRAGLGVQAAINFRDKGRMKDVLRAAGLPCARHATVTDAAGAMRFVEEVGFPVILKPPASAAAAGIVRISSVDELKRALNALAPSPQRPLVCEEFVVGEERSFETVSIGGQAVWDSSTRYAPPPLTVLENPWIQWTVLLPREQETDDVRAIRPVAHAALQALGMQTGISHMEWFRRRDGSVAISEVAARPPGAQFMTLNSWAHDADFYRLWAELVVHDHFKPLRRPWAAGAAYFRAQGGTDRVVRIHGVDEAQRAVGHLVVEAKLPRAGQTPSGGYEGEGYAIVRHESTAVVREALRHLVGLIRVEAE